MLLVFRAVGLSWEVSSLIALAALIGFWKVLASQPGTKNRGIDAFSELVRKLSMVMENGSVLKIKHKKSDVEFSFVRICGEGTEATVELRVPRAGWSTERSKEIEAAFRAQGFEYRKDKSMSGLIFVATFKIPDVWETASGAKGAHMARTLVRAAGLDDDSRFDARYDGMTSTRISEAKDRL